MLAVLRKPLALSFGDTAWVRHQLPLEEHSLLLSRGIELLVPISSHLSGDLPLALLALGPRRSEEPYNQEDLDLLVTIAEAGRSGALGREAAADLLQPLIALTRAAHARGLVHGSIVPGNIIVQPDAASACLLDFGLARLLDGSTREATSPLADLEGWTALARALR